MHIQDMAKKCRFCMQQHVTESCPKLIQMTVPQRIEALKRAGFCFRCLTWGHLARDCQLVNPPICRVCQLGHQSMLHGSSGWAPAAETPVTDPVDQADPLTADLGGEENQET